MADGEFDNLTVNNVLTIGADTNLYRTAADLMKTDDSLEVGTILYVDTLIRGNRADVDWLILEPKVAESYIRFNNPATADYPFSFLLSTTTPMMTLGPDVNLYRSAADKLKTDDWFIVPRVGIGTDNPIGLLDVQGVGVGVGVGITQKLYHGGLIYSGYWQTLAEHGWLALSAGDGRGVEFGNRDQFIFYTGINTKNVAYSSKSDSDRYFVVSSGDIEAGYAIPGTQFVVGENAYTVVFSRNLAGVTRVQVKEDISGEAASGTLTNLSYSYRHALLNSAGQLHLPVQGSSGGIVLGGDANLYRSAENTLKTEDRFHIVCPVSAVIPAYIKNQGWLWHYTSGIWDPSGMPIETTTNYLALQHPTLLDPNNNNQPYYADWTLAMIDNNRQDYPYSPIMYTHSAVMIQRDLSVGGFVASWQGALAVGHGLLKQMDPPKIWLIDSGTSFIDGIVYQPDAPANPKDAQLFICNSQSNPNYEYFHLYEWSDVSQSWNGLGDISIYQNQYFDTLHITKADGSTPANMNLGTITAHNVNPATSNTYGCGGGGNYWAGVVTNVLYYKGMSSFGCTKELSDRVIDRKFEKVEDAISLIKHENSKEWRHLKYGKKDGTVVCTCGKEVDWSSGQPKVCPEHQVEWEDKYLLKTNDLIEASAKIIPHLLERIEKLEKRIEGAS